MSDQLFAIFLRFVKTYSIVIEYFSFVSLVMPAFQNFSFSWRPYRFVNMMTADYAAHIQRRFNTETFFGSSHNTDSRLTLFSFLQSEIECCMFMVIRTQTNHVRMFLETQNISRYKFVQRSNGGKRRNQIDL